MLYTLDPKNMKAEKAKGKTAFNFKEDMNNIQILCLLHIIKIVLFEVLSVQDRMNLPFIYIKNCN